MVSRESKQLNMLPRCFLTISPAQVLSLLRGAMTRPPRIAGLQAIIHLRLQPATMGDLAVHHGKVDLVVLMSLGAILCRSLSMITISASLPTFNEPIRSSRPNT